MCHVRHFTPMPQIRPFSLAESRSFSSIRHPLLRASIPLAARTRTPHHRLCTRLLVAGGGIGCADDCAAAQARPRQLRASAPRSVDPVSRRAPACACCNVGSVLLRVGINDPTHLPTRSITSAIMWSVPSCLLFLLRRLTPIFKILHSLLFSENT